MIDKDLDHGLKIDFPEKTTVRSSIYSLTLFYSIQQNAYAKQIAQASYSLEFNRPLKLSIRTI